MADQSITKFAKFCTTALSAVFSVTFGILLVSLCFFNNSGNFHYSIINQLLSATAIGGTTVLCACLIKRAIDKREQLRTGLIKYFTLIFITSIAATFCFQLWYVSELSVPIGWDVGQLYNTASAPDMNVAFGYFSIYPNNLFLLFCYRALLKILGILGVADGWLVLSVVNTLLVDAAAILCVLSAKKLWGVRGGYISLILCLLSYGFFPWLIIPYSDTLAMPFTVLLFYLYLQLLSLKSKIARVILAAPAGVFACAGYFIKPTVIIIVIAVILIHFVFTHSLKYLLSALAFLLVFTLTFSAVNQAFDNFIDKQEYINIYEDQATPLTHFAMMGLYKHDWGDGNIQYGAYWKEDVSYTHMHKDPDAKVEANLKMIKERLQGYGFGGYMKFLLDKARWITSEGCFHWLGEGNFAQWDQAHDGVFKDLVTQKGKYFDVYLYFTQGMWILILLLSVLSPFLNKRSRRDRSTSLLRCTVIGILLFILMFEGRSRYFLLYLPFFLLLATEGLVNLSRFIQSHAKQKPVV